MSMLPEEFCVQYLEEHDPHEFYKVIQFIRDSGIPAYLSFGDIYSEYACCKRNVGGYFGRVTGAGAKYRLIATMAVPDRRITRLTLDEFLRLVNKAPEPKVSSLAKWINKIETTAI